MPLAKYNNCVNSSLMNVHHTATERTCEIPSNVLFSILGSTQVPYVTQLSLAWTKDIGSYNDTCLYFPFDYDHPQPKQMQPTLGLKKTNPCKKHRATSSPPQCLMLMNPQQCAYSTFSVALEDKSSKMSTKPCGTEMSCQSKKRSICFKWWWNPSFNQ